MATTPFTAVLPSDSLKPPGDITGAIFTSYIQSMIEVRLFLCRAKSDVFGRGVTGLTPADVATRSTRCAQTDRVSTANHVRMPCMRFTFDDLL